MPPAPDPEALWRRLLSELQGARGRTALFLAGSTVLLVLYPEEVIRAVFGSLVVLAMARALGPPH